ncbi:hypothetical protein DWG18_06035 [Lysobacter sp. TY2-98]|uniref:hypothetical protein n=1 Tax=Lysobacter sp. TY2-98 TaxID=2290922 RepID=UPI000E200C9C|nr:hypothetical protein [Lysobacter sp. TY2-98]AXK71889.1 hypothetical protein DWG18_06035 [Lysobacter sp. TY2-98]
MSVVNPYQSPAAELEVRHHDGCVRDGLGVFVPRGMDLPPRCIRCNAPAAGTPKRRTMYWHSSGWYVLILLNLVLYAIVALIVRKRVQLSPALCEPHRRRRRTLLAVGLVAFFGSLAAILGIEMADIDGPSWLFGLLAFAALVATVINVRLVRVTHIDEGGARVVGFDRSYLDGLPRPH